MTNFGYLKDYFSKGIVEKIKDGKSFYCNFYKISQSSEILHFGSFSPIKTDKPNFHIPIYFEEVRIER